MAGGLFVDHLGVDVTPFEDVVLASVVSTAGNLSAPPSISATHVNC